MPPVTPPLPPFTLPRPPDPPLTDCFERMLREAGVRTLVLPAAHETVETWKAGFSFTDMPEDDVG